MIGRSVLIRAAVLLASTVLGACAEAPDAGDPSTAEGSIINGSAATEPKYAAVGALVYMHPEVGVLDVFCSGTLVAAKAIVTARHCTPSIDVAFESGMVPAFALGPDAFNPTQLVPITRYVAAPAAPKPQRGLLQDGGRDVAVAHLASAPAGVRPARLGLFKNDMLNTRFHVAGFGVRDAQHSYGQKFAGPATARAVKGRWYELLFKNNYKEYRQWYFNDSPSAARTEAQARQWWDTYRLEDNFELLAGGLKGDVVACNGDSGGPLLQGNTASNLTVYGVNFAVENTISTACALGGGYLVFNQRMLDFVKSAL